MSNNMKYRLRKKLLVLSIVLVLSGIYIVPADAQQNTYTYYAYAVQIYNASIYEANQAITAINSNNTSAALWAAYYAYYFAFYGDFYLTHAVTSPSTIYQDAGNSARYYSRFAVQYYTLAYQALNKTTPDFNSAKGFLGVGNTYAQDTINFATTAAAGAVSCQSFATNPALACR